MSVTQLPTTVDGFRQLLLTSYARTSGDKLLALQGQDDQIVAWAHEHGYGIAGHEQDNEVEGIIPANDRRGLSAALNALEGPASGLIVTHLDRIARSVPVMLEVVDRIWDASRDLFSVWLPDRVAHWRGRIPRTLEGREFCREIAERAAYELSVLQWRLQGARRQKAARGEYIGGVRFHRRYGVALVPTGAGFEYQPVPREQETIRSICAQHAEGIGYQRIARGLNLQGVPSATGRAWSPKVVRDLVLRGPDEAGGAVTRRLAPVVPPTSGVVVPLRRGAGA